MGVPQRSLQRGQGLFTGSAPKSGPFQPGLIREPRTVIFRAVPGKRFRARKRPRWQPVGRGCQEVSHLEFPCRRMAGFQFDFSDVCLSLFSILGADPSRSRLGIRVLCGKYPYENGAPCGFRVTQAGMGDRGAGRGGLAFV